MDFAEYSRASFRQQSLRAAKYLHFHAFHVALDTRIAPEVRHKGTKQENAKRRGCETCLRCLDTDRFILQQR